MFKLYTKTGNSVFLKNMGKTHNVFTSQEWSKYSEVVFKNLYSSKENLYKNLFSIDRNKLEVVSLLLDEIEKNQHKSLLSMGASSGVLESLLKLAFNYLDITVSDFDEYAIKKGREYFPELKYQKFDFYKDNYTNSFSKNDLVVFIGSMYVMNDETIVRQLKDIRESGTKKIIDFHAGFLPLSEYLKRALVEVYYFFKQDQFRGKFHGYARTEKELKKLYIEAGWKIEEIKKTKQYKFITILH